MREPAIDLFVERADVRRKQAVQPEFIALTFVEGRAFVEQGITKKIQSGRLDLDGAAGCMQIGHPVCSAVEPARPC